MDLSKQCMEVSLNLKHVTMLLIWPKLGTKSICILVEILYLLYLILVSDAKILSGTLIINSSMTLLNKLSFYHVGFRKLNFIQGLKLYFTFNHKIQSI